jgi:hypothetical protein
MDACTGITCMQHHPRLLRQGVLLGDGMDRRGRRRRDADGSDGGEWDVDVGPSVVATAALSEAGVVVRPPFFVFFFFLPPVVVGRGHRTGGGDVARPRAPWTGARTARRGARLDATAATSRGSIPSASRASMAPRPCSANPLSSRASMAPRPCSTNPLSSRASMAPRPCSTRYETISHDESA